MSKMLSASVVGLVLITFPISAHHAFSALYDANKRITVSGVVTKFEWIKPHVWLYVDGKDESGNVRKWSFEMGSPTGLIRRGWSQTALKDGDQVTVEGFEAKDGGTRANAGVVTLPNGSKLFAGFQTTPGAPLK